MCAASLKKIVAEIATLQPEKSVFRYAAKRLRQISRDRYKEHLTKVIPNQAKKYEAVATSPEKKRMGKSQSRKQVLLVVNLRGPYSLRTAGHSHE